MFTALRTLGLGDGHCTFPGVYPLGAFGKALEIRVSVGVSSDDLGKCLRPEAKQTTKRRDMRIFHSSMMNVESLLSGKNREEI